MIAQRHNPAYRFAYTNKVLNPRTFEGLLHYKRKVIADNIMRKIRVGMGVVYVCLLFLLTGCGGKNDGIADFMTNEGVIEEQEAKETQKKDEFSAESDSVKTSMDTVEIDGRMVRILSGDKIGSGVVYKETDTEWIIVTAGHVTPDKNNVFVSFCGEIGRTADSVRTTNSDLVFVIVDKSDFTAEEAANIRSVTIDKEKYDELMVGDAVKAVGSYHEIAKDICEGTVKEKLIFASSINEMVIMAKMKCFAGMSGSGLFDVEGNFLGIVCAVGEEDETAIIPLITILAKEKEAFPE